MEGGRDGDFFAPSLHACHEAVHKLEQNAGQRAGSSAHSDDLLVAQLQHASLAGNPFAAPFSHSAPPQPICLAPPPLLPDDEAGAPVWPRLEENRAAPDYGLLRTVDGGTVIAPPMPPPGEQRQSAPRHRRPPPRGAAGLRSLANALLIQERAISKARRRPETARALANKRIGAHSRGAKPHKPVDWLDMGRVKLGGIGSGTAAEGADASGLASEFGCSLQVTAPAPAEDDVERSVAARLRQIDRGSRMLEEVD